MGQDIEIHENLIRSAAVRSESLDEATAKRLLKIINEKHARRRLEADEVFLFPGVITSQHIDSYGTRMALSSLRNYRKDIGVGIPLMNSHRTGGGLFGPPAELPLGRIFDSKLEGEAIPTTFVEFDDQGGSELLAFQYMVRGLQLTDVQADQVIEGIETGVITDQSITFAMGLEGRLTCSICGENYWPTRASQGEEVCSHIAFVVYDTDDGARRCFAWVEKAHVYEASLVWAGANPGAMIRKVEAHAGELGQLDRAMLEDVYHVRFMGAKTAPIIKPAAENRQPSPEKSTEVESMDRDELLALLAPIFDGDQVSRLADDVEDAQLAETVVRHLVAEHDRLTGQLEAQEPDAKIGKQYLADLVAEAVAERVRAEGEGFDAERYEDVLTRSADLDFIKSEIESWKARAAEVLKDGPGDTRPTGDDGKPTERAPAAAYR